MSGVYEFDHNGKRILCLDIAGLQSKDKKEIRGYVESAKEIIRKQPAKSLLVITNVIKTGFDSEFAGIIKDYAQHNTPFVKASSVVGIEGWAKIILIAVKKLTGRDSHLANTMDEAKEWLVKQ
jgi:hypothetical protein